VTASHPAPTWAHIEAFCNADEWQEVRETDHVHWEKVLPSGEVLKTHRSFAADKAISLGRFSLILREQLKVSREEFWRAIETGNPVDRPVELDEQPPEYPAWVIWGLRGYGITEDQVRQMSPAEAEAPLHARWATPPGKVDDD